MLSFFPRGVLDEILNLIESVSEGFPSYSYSSECFMPSENWKFETDCFQILYPDKLQLCNVMLLVDCLGIV